MSSKRKAEEDDEAFPRSRPTAAGAGAGEAVASGPSRERKKSKKANDADEEAADPRTSRFVPRLRFSDLGAGSVVMAAVNEVNEEEITLNLPFNLLGFASRAMALEPREDEIKAPEDLKLKDLYPLGTLVVAVVTAIVEIGDSKKQRIEVSLRPSLANAGLTSATLLPGMWLPAEVKGDEEHVIRLSFGVDGLSSGVLKKSELLANASPKLGSILMVTVASVTSGGTVRCSASIEAIDDVALDQGLLKPGFLVKAKVEQVLEQQMQGVTEGTNAGLLLSFCGSLTGFVHFHHEASALDEESNIKRKKRVMARVLAVVPGATLTVYLTMLPHHLDWTSQGETLTSAVEVGDRVESEVIDFFPRLGCRLKCTQSDEALLAFCPPNRLSEKDTEPQADTLEPGFSAQCRVLGYNFLDAAILVSRRPADLKDVLVSVKELKDGQLVTGEVTRLADFGIFVQLSEYVTGLVHLRHLTDVPLATVPKKFQLGTKVKCRVLRVFPDRRQLSLTAKKSLVSSDFQLSDVLQARVNMLVTGYVSSLKDYGAIVNFFGNARGLLPSKDMEQDSAPAVGMAVRCRISRIDRKKSRMILSLGLDGGRPAAELADSVEKAEFTGAAPGNIIESPRALRCTALGVIVRIEAADAAKGQTSLGFVLVGHLADNPALAKDFHEALASQLGFMNGDEDLAAIAAEEGQLLAPEAVVLAHTFNPEYLSSEKSRSGTSRGPRFKLLSIKASLCLAAESGAFVTEVATLKEGKLYTGYVKELADFGAIVSVGAYRCSGIAFKHQLGSKFVDKPSDAIQIGQTVRVRVGEIDAEKGRFNADLRPGMAKSSDMQLFTREAEALRRDFDAQEALAASQEPGKKAAQRRAQVLPGALLDAVVSAVKPYGLLLSLPQEGLTAVALKENMPEESRDVAEGTSLRCAVLDFDPKSSIVDVSLQPELVEGPLPDGHAASASGKKKRRNTDENLAEGQELLALPALQKPAYSVLWCKSPPAVLFVPPFGHRSWDEARETTVHSLPSADAKGLACGRIIARCPVGGQEKLSRLKVPKISRPEEELQVGSPITMKIVSIHGFQVFCSAPVGIRGHVHATQCVDPGELGSTLPMPLEELQHKKTIEARILSLRQRGEGGEKTWHVELTCRPSLLQACDAADYQHAVVKWSNLKPGMRVVAVVVSTRHNRLWLEVAPGIKGQVSLLDASKDPAVLKNLADHFQIGQAIQAAVLKVVRSSKRLELALHSAALTDPGEDGAQEKKVLVKLLRLEESSAKGIVALFRLPGQRRGYVHITELFDIWVQQPMRRLKPGTIHEAYILRDSHEAAPEGIGLEGKAEISLRPSLVHGRKESQEERRPATVRELKVGQKLSGYVVNSGPKGVFVAISRAITARIKLKCLSDQHVQQEAVKKLFPVGMLVRDAAIVDLDSEKNLVELSLRKNEASGKLTVEQLSVGDVVSGKVKSIEKYGFFVRLDNSVGVDGLVHRSEVSDSASVSIDSFQIGTKIARAKVIKIEGRKIALTLKPSNFDADEMDEEEEEDEQDELDEKPHAKPANVKAKAGTSAARAPGREKEHNGDEDEDEDEEDDDKQEQKSSKPGNSKRKAGESVELPKVPVPKVSKDDSDDEPWLRAPTSGDATFEWADFKVAEVSGSSDEEAEGEETEEQKRPSKRQKKALKVAEEKQLQKQEVENAEGKWAADPRNVEDFERLLLTQGGTSIVWIRYMAFHLKLSDIEKARQVAERAVKHVGFSDAKERFNAWVAYMNLECTFGTEESADAVFKRASSHNDAKQVYLQLARIHERNKKPKLATKVYEACCRKFGHSKKVWLAFLTFLYKEADLEAGRKLLPKCLACLPRRKHPFVVSKAALLEYQSGSPERGRSVFEGLLDSYPKRTDLWSVYIDAHIKAYTPPKVDAPDLQEIRSLLQRCCTMKLKALKMRFFFKRWLDFEKRWGDEESQEKVRQKAREFVEVQGV